MHIPSSNRPSSSIRCVVTLTSATVILAHVVTGSWRMSSTKVRVSVSKESAGPPLEVVQNSSTAGYIQTPRRGAISSHRKCMNSVVRVHVPENHMAMFTILQMNLATLPKLKGRCNLPKVNLTVVEIKETTTTLIWNCSSLPPPARHRLPRGWDLAVNFIQSGNAEGFRLFYSVIEESSLPRAGSGNDTWNCSVPNFAELKPHFPCDLQPQCLHGEDERGCPYYSEQCGQRFVTVGAHCLVYVRNGRAMTWRLNEYVCQQRRLKMVSIKRREDYDELIGYLQPMAAYWGFWKIAVGLHTSWSSLPSMYQNEMQHADGTIAFHRWTHHTTNFKYTCGFINLNNKSYKTLIKVSYCSRPFPRYDVLCERPRTQPAEEFSPPKIALRPNSSQRRLPLVACPRGHVTRDFLACDAGSACWSRDGKSCPEVPLKPHPPSFACANDLSSVPYTLVCDVRPDCSDGSDESFCQFPPCDLPEPFYCSERECVPRSALCDGQKHCYNALDEELCSAKPVRHILRPKPPTVVQLGLDGRFSVNIMTAAGCPETHFLCQDDRYCMPVFLRCNGASDCPGNEDEKFCVSYTCPGFYRCRHSLVCLHPDHLCDQVFQCPHSDDELFCDFTCPKSCTCYGLAFYCRQPFHARNFTKGSPSAVVSSQRDSFQPPEEEVRYLDCRGSGTNTVDLSKNVQLIYLSVADNGLTSVGDLDFPNLHGLDFSDNRLKRVTLHDLRRLPKLKTLSLAGNPLLSLFLPHGRPDRTYGPAHSAETGNVLRQRGGSLEWTRVPLHGTIRLERPNTTSPDNVKSTFTQSSHRNVGMLSLRTLDLSRVKVDVSNMNFLSQMPNLHTVNLSGSGLDTLLEKGFQDAKGLRVLDLRGCPLTHFPRDLFRGLQQLETVHSDNYKLCCPATLPADFIAKNCYSPPDEVSSCKALLKSDIYRVFLSGFATLALLGNASSFVYRVFLQRRKRLQSFDVFVAYLCVADFSMGVYLGVIGVADRLYLGTYLWEDNSWKASAVCRTAGFLSLASSEVSVLVICLITLDRFLALRFPFGTFHFGARAAQAASLCAWGVGCLIAATPLTPWVARWNFYSQTGICIPLPISGTRSPGFAYSFGVMVVSNFVLFILIVCGQVSIYWSICANALSSAEATSTRKAHDLTIARRLVTVAVSDFLCWFPIGLAGILAVTGTPISGEVNVAFAIFVLPFNSALNPFLYTLNIVLEKRRKLKEERVRKRLMAQLRLAGKDDKTVSSRGSGTKSPS